MNAEQAAAAIFADVPLTDEGRAYITHIIQQAIDDKTKALQAIVDKLPKYADTGGPIAPDMVVWLVQSGRLSERKVRSVSAGLVGVVEDGPSGTCRGLAHYPERRCYSTHEAAEAAKEAKT
jgi:hypothetical protein